MSAPAQEQPGATSDTVSTRSLAELARAGFTLLRQPSMRIAYEVHHLQDRPGYLQEVLRGVFGQAFTHDSDPATDSEEDPTPHFIETLATAAYGTGLVVGIRTISGLPDARLDASELSHTNVTVAPDKTNQSLLFRASTKPNVSFVYDSTRVFEGLIAVEIEPANALWLWHARAIRDVVRTISKIAFENARAPILSLVSPAQVPSREFSTPDRPIRAWRSSALAVRFSIALPRPSAKMRMDIADAFVKFCSPRGFGFWMADSRSGYRTGNWFTILPHNTELVRKTFDVSPPPRAARRAQHCVPLTFVGPARRDSVRAILNYLAHFSRVGVLACSMATIDDVAFIHLQLTTHIEDAEALNTDLARLAGSDDPPAVLRGILLRLQGQDVAEIPEDTRQDLTQRVGDHQMLVGPVQHARSDAGHRGALWVSWEVEGRHAELSVPFLALNDALGDLGLFNNRQRPNSPTESPNVEYLICRKVRNSVLRGKGKISFVEEVLDRVSGDDLAERLSRFSETVENAWRARLDEQHRVRELTVSWREYWLGHWTHPLD